MSSLLLWASLALAGTVTDAKGRQVTVDDNTRILCLGGSITETVVALGLESQLVGVDASSLYPESVSSLPQVGYYRAVSAEGVLSLEPTVLLALEGSGPPPVMAQLEATGLPIVYLEEADSVPEARARIETVATALDADASTLLGTFDDEVNAGLASALPNAPRVLFIYARAGGVMNVAGTDTSADAMIRLAGGVNAASGFSGYRPLTPEAAVAAAPDVVLFTTGGLEAAGGREAALKSPALALTPAGQQGALAVVDDLLLLGFGPRTGKAIATLTQALRDALG